MLKDYIILDNALDDPDKLIDLAKTISYHSSGDMKIKNVKLCPPDEDKSLVCGNWKGFRSNPLWSINPEYSNEILFQIFSKILLPEITVEWNVDSHLHYFPKGLKYGDWWWHKDEVFMAGVLYLNKNPKKYSGTIVKINGTDVVLDNVFNRFVLYNSLLEHRPQSGFGTKDTDARLTLTVFVNTLKFGRINS